MNKIAQVPINVPFNSPWGVTVAGQGRGFAYFVSVILSNAIVIAAILLLFLLIFGGISIIIGAGSGKKDDVAKGQKAVTAAVAGFLIIFTAYWIIRIVEVITGLGTINGPGSILNPNF